MSRFLWVCSPVNIDHCANPGASGPVQILWVCSPVNTDHFANPGASGPVQVLQVCSPVNIDHFANPGASGPVQMDLPERAWAPSHFVAPACVPLTQSLGRTLGRDKQHMSHHFCQRFQDLVFLLAVWVHHMIVKGLPTSLQPLSQV